MNPKRLAQRAISIRALVPSETRFVFIYHDVSGPDTPHFSPLYSTPPATFLTHVAFFQDLFDLVSLEMLLHDQPQNNARRRAAITFDDGFLSVLHNAAPALMERNIPFTLFLNGEAITTDHLSYAPPSPLKRGSVRVFLDEAEVRGLANEGATIGSHSWSHRVLADCEGPALHKEVRSNKTYLEGLISKPVTDFAIPYGKRQHYSEAVITECREAGHERIYTSNPTNITNASQMLIPRVGLTNETTRDLLFLINRPRFKTIDI